MSSHKPRKRFGQHFLTDLGVIQRIIDAIHPMPTDHLVEIGPGQGALTTHLVNAVQRCDLIEIDNDLVPKLQAQFKNQPQVTIHHVDALEFDFSSLATPTDRARVVGNLPYNISTPLIFHLLESEHTIRDMVFMLQKEVVERMAATVGDDAYGRLSIMVQYHCEVEPLFVIGPDAFFPPPRVDSQMVRLVPHTEKPYLAQNPALFAKIVTQAFGQRRKTIRNALKKEIPDVVWEQSQWDISHRPETFGLDDYVLLSNLLDNYLKSSQ